MLERFPILLFVLLFCLYQPSQNQSQTPYFVDRNPPIPQNPFDASDPSSPKPFQTDNTQSSFFQQNPSSPNQPIDPTSFQWQQFANTQFENFKKTYRKVYKNSEEQIRFRVFKENLQGIIIHNQQRNITYWLQVNQFTDLSKEQFSLMYGGLFEGGTIQEVERDIRASQKLQQSKKDCESRIKSLQNILIDPIEKQTLFSKFSAELGIIGILSNPNKGPISGNIPIEFDWTPYTPQIIHQHPSCRSCYAITTTHSIQALLNRTAQLSQPFSIQQLLDCAHQPYNGCAGGYLYESYSYAKNEGIGHYSSYLGNQDLQSSNGCLSKVSHFRISSFNRLNYGCSLMKFLMKDTLFSAPVSSSHLQSYGHGILQCQQSSLYIDHAVLIVSYIVSENAWKIKNSWGTDWGEGGYARISNQNQKDCGVCLYSYFPMI